MKTKILLASISLFAEKGYNETSISDILNRLNISKGGLYYYFKSKEEIIISIVELFVSSILKYVSENFKDGMKTQEKLNLIALAKNNIDDDIKQGLISMLEKKDPYIIDIFISNLRKGMVPLIIQMFFSNVKNKDEQIAKANILFGITQISLYLPSEISANSNVMKKFMQNQNELILKLLED